MARKNKSQQTSADDILKQMFPDLQTTDDVYDDDGQDKTKQKDTEAVDKVIADLQAKIAGLEGTVAATRDRPVQDPAIQLGPPAPPVFPDLPNPAEDPNGYRDAVLAQTQALIKYEKDLYQYQNRQTAASSAKSNDLWADFSTKYEDYAENEERIEIATTRIIQKAQARGVDVDKFMYGNRDGFMKQVVDEYDRLFGKPVIDDTDTDEDDDDNRASVMGAGAPSQRGGPANVQTPPNPYGELSQEILAWQQKTGFTR